MKMQSLHRADMRSILNSCFDIDPVEKRFDRLAHGTHIRRKGIVRGNPFISLNLGQLLLLRRCIPARNLLSLP